MVNLGPVDASDGSPPDIRAPKPYRTVGADVFQEQTEQEQPLIVVGKMNRLMTRFADAQADGG